MKTTKEQSPQSNMKCDGFVTNETLKQNLEGVEQHIEDVEGRISDLENEMERYVSGLQGQIDYLIRQTAKTVK